MSVKNWNANGPTVTIEIGVTTNTTSTASVWDVGVWNSATWGRDVIWTDISQYVREININRGKQRSSEFFRHSVGTMTAILDNRDDRFSPVNLSGPYVSAGATQIRPRIPIRVTFTFTPIPVGAGLFYGFVDVWQDQFPGTKDATTYIECSDVLSVLARFNGSEQSSQGGGETFGARIIRICENAGFNGTVHGSTGSVALQSTTLAQNALTEATLAADTENGALFADDSGVITAWGIDHLINQLGLGTSGAFADFGDGGYPIADPVFSYDADLVYNRVSFARSGGVQQTVADLESIARYGDLAYARSDLIAEDDTDVLGSATVFLARFHEPEYRVSSITLYPMQDTSARTTITQTLDSLWWNSIGLDLMNCVNVTATTPGGTQVESLAYIDGISHTIRPREWITTYSLASRTLFVEWNESYWDFGRWDEGRWFFG